MQIDSGRLKRLVGTGAVLSLFVTAIFAWLTAVPRTPLPAPIVRPVLSPTSLVLLPDRGEPRTARLAQLEKLLQQLNAETADPGQLADIWLSVADVRMQLEKFAGSQEATEMARKLCPAADSWQSRESVLLQQELHGWEVMETQQLQLRRDRIVQHERALRLHASGDYLQAIDSAREAVASQRQLLAMIRAAGEAGDTAAADGDEARLASELLVLGSLTLEHCNTYGEAAGILQEANELTAAVRGTSHPVYAEVLAALARVEDERGYFDEADDYYEKALQVLRASRGENSIDFARTLARQSRMHMDWWKDYGEGKGYRALDIRQRLLGDDHLECAESFEHLGINALWLLNFDQADELLQRAYTIRTREQGMNHPDTADARSWLSQVYIAKGDVAKASLYLQEAIQLTRSHRGESHPRLVRLLANVAHLGRDDWNQPRGEREARRGADIAAKVGTSRHPATFDAMIALGDLMLEEESPYGVAQVRRINPSYIADYTREVIAAHEACPHAEQLPSYATALINLAHTGYWDDYQSVTREEAARLLERSLANMQQYGDESHPAFAEYLNVLGRWHLWVGEEETGRRHLQKSLEVVESRHGIVLSERRASAWRSLAGGYMHAGEFTPEMDECLQTVARLDEEIYRQNAAGQCDIDRYCMSRARFFSVGVCALHPAIRLSDEQRYRQILSAKGSIARLQLNERMLYERAELKPLLDTVRESRRRLKMVAYDLPAVKDAGVWRESLFTAADEKESGERELAIRSRPYIPPMSGFDPSEVRAQVPDDAVLLDFVDYTALGPPKSGKGRLDRERRIGVFVVSGNEEIRFIDLGNSSLVESAVTKWVETMRDPEGTDTALESCAMDVARLIWKPVQNSVGNRRLILIAPDGPVCFVPFAALPGNQPGSYLLEEKTIGYIPSSRQWCDLLKQNEQPKIDGLLAVGDVNYGGDQPNPERQTLGMRAFDPAAMAWENLPATRAETEQICELMENLGNRNVRTRLLTGSAPSIDQLQAALSERWRYFHFAGHGLFADLQANWTSQDNKDLESRDSSNSWMLTKDEAIVFGRAPQLLSGLVLTRPDTSNHPADAILTAEEVSSLDLRGTELVVLSACETALGNTIGGEGVLGLQRAFLNAGARSTVSSLWKVGDAATNLLMERFYRKLWNEKLPKWEALRQAQLELLRNPTLIDERSKLLVSRGFRVSRGIATGQVKSISPSDEDATKSVSRSHPFFWAAFVLYGDGR